MTGLPCPNPSKDNLGVQIVRESHDNDGVGDDYEYYHDYDVSMEAAGTVTSIAEVEQADWWSAAHSAIETHATSLRVLQQSLWCRNIQFKLKLADYELLSLRNASELPDFQMDELVSIPAWIVEAHAESTNSTSLVLSNDLHQRGTVCTHSCMFCSVG